MDIGIYCINAARYLFRDEPEEVLAMAATSNDPRFSEIEESLSAVLKFPGQKLASFSCSFGASDVSRYEVIGTEGSLSLDPAYEYAVELQFKLKAKEEQITKIPKHDQFAPELLHFADCINEDKQPRPSGYEGLNDLRVIDAIRESIETNSPVKVKGSKKSSKPDRELVLEKPGVEKPELVNVKSGSR
jgi:glucose-fructose oxidoreductase